MTITHSEGVADPDWDRFVEGHPLGQFQQSTMWAEAKVPEGWGARRVVIRNGTEIRAGAQILQKVTRAGRIGFINKGPIVSEADEDARRALVSALVEVQRSSGYRVFLVQLPDWGDFMVSSLGPGGFIPEKVVRMADATLLIDVSKGWEAVHAEFNRTTRKKMRRGAERGVQIVEGSADDVGDFFALMKSTCERQGTRPNPANLPIATALLRAFGTKQKARIWFAEHDGKRIAGGFAIAFGNRVVFWKKGWDQSASEMHVNIMINADIIRWSTEHGYRWLDFGSIDRDTAEAMVAGKDLPSDVPSRRDFFNLGFGGQGLLMPPRLIRFSNPVVSLGYRMATMGPFRTKTQNMLAKMGFGI